MPRKRGAKGRERVRELPLIEEWFEAPRSAAAEVRCGRWGCGARIGFADVADMLGTHARALVANNAAVAGPAGLPPIGPPRQFRCRVHGLFPVVSEQRLYQLWLEARLPRIIGEPAKPIVLS